MQEAHAKILVVDDERAVTESLAAILRHYGYEVISASDGREGLDKAQSEKPQLIIMDLVMPGMSGIEAVQELRKDPTLCRIPVVMLSAIDRLDDMNLGLEMGVQLYLTKPYEMTDLLRTVEHVLQAGPAPEPPREPPPIVHHSGPHISAGHSAEPHGDDKT